MWVSSFLSNCHCRTHLFAFLLQTVLLALASAGWHKEFCCHWMTFQQYPATWSRSCGLWIHWDCHLCGSPSGTCQCYAWLQKIWSVTCETYLTAGIFLHPLFLPQPCSANGLCACRDECWCGLSPLALFYSLPVFPWACEQKKTPNSTLHSSFGKVGMGLACEQDPESCCQMTKSKRFFYMLAKVVVLLQAVVSEWGKKSPTHKKLMQETTQVDALQLL